MKLVCRTNKNHSRSNREFGPEYALLDLSPGRAAELLEWMDEAGRLGEAIRIQFVDNSLTWFTDYQGLDSALVAGSKEKAGGRGVFLTDAIRVACHQWHEPADELRIPEKVEIPEGAEQPDEIWPCTFHSDYGEVSIGRDDIIWNANTKDDGFCHCGTKALKRETILAVAGGLYQKHEHKQVFLVEDEAVEDEDEARNRGRLVTVSATGAGLGIVPEGYGDLCSPDGKGVPILIDYYDGRLRVVVWSDINQEDPTHTIDLEGARESARLFVDNSVERPSESLKTLGT
jgi:hypothetical protein